MKLILILMLLHLAACASLGPQFSEHKIENKDKAKLYIYRVSKFVGWGGSPYVCIDDQVVGEIPNGAYLDLEIASGKKNVRLMTAPGYYANVDLNLKKGETHFLRTDFSIFKNIGKNIKASRAGTVGTGAISSGADAIFLGDKKEVQEKLQSFDSKTQSELNNPGFMAVNSKLGFEEIKDTKIFSPKKYSQNHCLKK